MKIIENRGDRSAYFLSGSPGYQVIKEGGIKWRHRTRLNYNQPDKPTSSDRGQFPGLNAALTRRRRRRRLKLRNVSVCAASSSSVVTLSTSPLLTLAGQEYWSILGGHVSKQFLPYWWKTINFMWSRYKLLIKYKDDIYIVDSKTRWKCSGLHIMLLLC